MSDAKKPSKLRRSLFTIFFMFAVTFVFIAVLSLIYVLTRDIITQRISGGQTSRTVRGRS